MDDFATRLRAAIASKATTLGRTPTQADIAKAVGVERNTVVGWLTRGAEPKDPTVYLKLAGYLDVEPEDLQPPPESVGEAWRNARARFPVATRLDREALIWLQRFRLELSEKGADERFLAWAERVLTSPANLLDQSADAPARLAHMQAFSQGIVAVLAGQAKAAVTSPAYLGQPGKVKPATGKPAKKTGRASR